MTTHQEIAADIRSRIEQGRLRPGERVPSTRAIAREWGVAIATATRALATLQSQGLVRSVVGVGTIVTDRPLTSVPPRAREADRALSRERIVRAAVAIADAEGMVSVTMRRLATELDVAVMSLYRHVPSKEELAVLMVDHIFGEAPLPDPPPAGWRERIEVVARMQWALGKRHPWMPSLMSLTRPLMVPKGMAHTDWCMRVLRELGFSPETALYVTVALAGLLIGVGATLQMEADAQRDTGLTSDEWMDATGDAFERLGAATRFPMIAEVSMIPGFDMRLDDVFETGLALMLDGIAQRVPRRAQSDGLPSRRAQKSVRSSRSMPRSAS